MVWILTSHDHGIYILSWRSIKEFLGFAKAYCRLSPLFNWRKYWMGGMVVVAVKLCRGDGFTNERCHNNQRFIRKKLRIVCPCRTIVSQHQLLKLTKIAMGGILAQAKKLKYNILFFYHPAVALIGGLKMGISHANANYSAPSFPFKRNLRRPSVSHFVLTPCLSTSSFEPFTSSTPT